MNELNEFLSKVDIFFGLNEEERDQILDGATEKKVRRRDTICDSGAPPQHMFVITSGTAKTFRGDNGSPRLLVDFLRAGEVLGEDSVLLSTENEINACPFDSCSVLCIPSENIKGILDNQPRLGRALAALSASRARVYRERLFQMTTIPVPVRLAGALYMLAKNFGRKDRQGTLIALRVTHQDLADYVGAARETVTLFLSKFKKDGLIVMNVRKIIIPDMKALKREAQL